MTEAAMQRQARSVFVWDASVRFFHWLLLVIVLLAWFTGEGEGAAAVVHRFAGETALGLIVFRVIWGFIGGEHARFRAFVRGPGAMAAHVRDLGSPAPKRWLGHNPVGGFAVLLLLITVAVVAATGLFSGGEKGGGPFAGLWGLELSEAHEISFRVLQALVVVHVLGVLIETIRARDGLVPAMITGRKRRRASEPGADARRASVGALIIALLAGAAVSAALMVQSPRAPFTEAEQERGYDD
jgi:cytochrome b